MGALRVQMTSCSGPDATKSGFQLDGPANGWPARARSWAVSGSRQGRMLGMMRTPLRMAGDEEPPCSQQQIGRGTEFVRGNKCGAAARQLGQLTPAPAVRLTAWLTQHSMQQRRDRLVVDGWMDGWMQEAARRVTWIRAWQHAAANNSAPASSGQQPAAGRCHPVAGPLAGVSLGSRWGASLGLAALWPLPHAREHTHARPHINTAWGRASNQQLANIRCLPVLQGKHAPLVFAPVNPSALPAPLGGRLQRHFTILRFHKSTTARQRDRTPPPAAPSSDGTMSPRDT